MLLLSVILANAVTTLYAMPAKESNNTGDDLSSRIWYGEYADISEYPYFAYLNGTCGAGIISDRWLITAAHCIKGVKKDRVNRAWVGGNTTQTSQVYAIDYAVIHPGYISNDYITINDIALLHLAQPLTFSNTVQPLDLPEMEYVLNAVHKFAGHGKDEHNDVTEYLMSMEVRTLGVKECMSNLPETQIRGYTYRLDHVNKVVICVKRIDNKPGACHGDSGSPLVRGNTLVGIASYIPGPTCQESRVGMFANVAPFVGWIKDITGIGYSRDSEYGDDFPFKWGFWSWISQ
ncbi:CLIP domain-containing serine protease B4-like [Cydia strobilella]|uniref:CLIP domain-containing serine protease B4-like n=1 Tax=Cydia strobilella TaxID=1100964 RepID=UPI003004C7F6